MPTNDFPGRCYHCSEQIFVGMTLKEISVTQEEYFEIFWYFKVKYFFCRFIYLEPKMDNSKTCPGG